ncbi:hypothetical protein JTE90_014323 [Oedothorax gibbosus]|uniref:Uncharacterized protein n=1 Tax=Oedothorax gibbosus TaxID=931172 RepID=A0AAV6UUC3_9ARAC|nr:hypothetical protein JTE90_014323 [Oedothorax gibbosus]
MVDQTIPYSLKTSHISFHHLTQQNRPRCQPGGYNSPGAINKVHTTREKLPPRYRTSPKCFKIEIYYPQPLVFGNRNE